MRKIKRLTCISLLFAAPVCALALEISDYQTSTRVMKQCAQIATQIQSTPVPEGHEAARRVIATNKILESQGLTGQMAPVAPIHVNYYNWISMATNSLSECNKNHGVAMQKIESSVFDMKEQDKKIDSSKIGVWQQILNEWAAAQQELGLAIAGLSKNRTIQYYVHPALQVGIIRPQSNNK